MRLIRLLKRDLAAEAARWVDQGLVSLDQARSICLLYGIDYDGIGRSAVAYRALVVLAFVFVGLALVTVIGANWDAVPRGVRLAALLVLTGGTQAFAVACHLEGHPSRAKGFALLGNFFYGASIIFVAQIYHLGEHMPDGVFWWALGTVPFAVLLRSPGLMLASALLALLWLVVELRSGLVGAVFLTLAFPVFLVAEAWALARTRGGTLLGLAFVAGVAAWVLVALATAWMDERGRAVWSAEHAVIVLGLLVLFHGAARWLGVQDGARVQDLGAVLAVWTVRAAVAVLLVMSVEPAWTALLDASWSHRWSMLAALAVLVAAGLALAWRAGRIGDVLVPAALVGTVMVVIAGAVAWSGAVGVPVRAVHLEVVDSVVLLGLGIWLIVRGAATGVSHSFFLGVASIVLLAFIRYLDLVGDYLGAAVLFVAFAGVLLVAARYWRARQAPA